MAEQDPLDHLPDHRFLNVDGLLTESSLPHDGTAEDTEHVERRDYDIRSRLRSIDAPFDANVQLAEMGPLMEWS